MFSDYEKKLVRYGISNGRRMDGRGLREVRSIKIDKNPLATGSSSVVVKYGDCHVLAASRLELVPPYSQTPDRGIVSFTVQASSSGLPMVQDKLLDYRLQEAAFHLNRSFAGGEEDILKSLCLKPAVLCLSVNVNLQIIELCGNLIDTCSVAAKACLLLARIPIVKEFESLKNDRLELAEDPDEYRTVNFDDVPLLITVAKSDDHYFTDPSAELESVDSSSVVGFSSSSLRTQSICYYSLNRGFSLDAQSSKLVIAEGYLIGSLINERLEQFLKDEHQTSANLVIRLPTSERRLEE